MKYQTPHIQTQITNFTSNTSNMSNDVEARRGGKLEDTAAHGTSIPSDSGTQPVVPSSRNEKAEKAYGATTRTNPLDPAITDNVINMPSGTGDGGLTGEVVTGIGDQLPVDVEAKRLGQDSSGGKDFGASKHTLKDKRSRAIQTGQDHVGSGPA